MFVSGKKTKKSRDCIWNTVSHLHGLQKGSPVLLSLTNSAPTPYTVNLKHVISSTLKSLEATACQFATLYPFFPLIQFKVKGCRRGYIRDRSPVCHRATTGWQTTIHAYGESPINPTCISLYCGRMLENREIMQASAGWLLWGDGLHLHATILSSNY